MHPTTNGFGLNSGIGRNYLVDGARHHAPGLGSWSPSPHLYGVRDTETSNTIGGHLMTHGEPDEIQAL